MSTNIGRHAIVLGGSIAGLLATRVLSDCFDRVTFIERDQLQDSVESRKGVPQGRHAHALLARGEELLSELFPGFTNDLVAGGASVGDIGKSIRWYQFGGYKRPHTFGRNVYTQTRPFLEMHVRRRVTALQNVRVLDGRSVTNLVCAQDRITGVELNGGTAELLEADLVVDATGRGSATPRWLKDIGFDAPEESVVTINVGYSTRFYRRAAGSAGEMIYLAFPQPPDQRRVGTLLPVEGDRWICTLGGWLGDYPPIEPAGFLGFARSLPAHDIYNVISKAEPLSAPVPHRFPANLRRHYEALNRFPERYLVLGDAVCSFNPIYGQGMTSASLQARELRNALASGLTSDLSKRFFEAVSKVIDTPWKMAAGEDFRFPEVKGPKPAGTDFFNWYVAQVHRAVMRNTGIYSDFLLVSNMLAPPSLLLKPANVVRLLAGLLR